MDISKPSCRFFSVCVCVCVCGGGGGGQGGQFAPPPLFVVCYTHDLSCTCYMLKNVLIFEGIFPISSPDPWHSSLACVFLSCLPVYLSLHPTSNVASVHIRGGWKWCN